MKNVPEVYDALRTHYEVRALPRLVAEWNMNRYFDVLAHNVHPLYEGLLGYDPERFPIASIVEPLRPLKGISKAITNMSLISDNYESNSSQRFYISGADDKFKYWISPEMSNSSGNISNCSPYIIYGQDIQVNKIRIRLENTWASPRLYTVQVTYDGTNWSTISTNPAIDDDGNIILNWNGTGWAVTRPDDVQALRTIRGVKLNVTALGPGRSRRRRPDGTVDSEITRYWTPFGWVSSTGNNAFLSIIEITALREVDLTDRLVSVSDKQDAGERSQVNPVGTMTTNEASIELWNGDGVLSEDNESSPYYGLLDANVEMNLEYVYDIDNVEYRVQQFKMYTDKWDNQLESKVSVALADFSKFLKGIIVPEMLQEGETFSRLVYRVCDSVGFNNFIIDWHEDLVDFVVPIFYTDGKENVIEVLDELAKAAQSLIFFDASGTLRVKTRESAFDMSRSPDWTLYGQENGDILPDIISLSEAEDFGANVVRVRYQTTRWSDWNNGQPVMQTVWEPDGTVTLRATDLKRSMGSGLDNIYISQQAVKTWPYSGIVNIEGELIRYDGKEFTYYVQWPNAGPVPVKKFIKTADEFKKLNSDTPIEYRHMNSFTGALKTIERGVWNTQVSSHGDQYGNYDIRRYVDGNLHAGDAGYSPNKSKSIITLASAGNLKSPADRLYMTRGAPNGTGYIRYGFKFKLEKGSEFSHKRVGLVFHNQTFNEDGYYVEFTASSIFGGEERQERNELMFYTRKNGSFKALGGQKDKGVALNIASDEWYEVDVYVKKGDNHNVQIWVNGKKRMNVTVSGGDMNSVGDKFGLYIRGKTRAEFEYLYAIKRPVKEHPDDITILNKIEGGYYGQMAERDIPFQWNSESSIVKHTSEKEKLKKDRYVFDDFGPIVHEVREYDVKFSTSPVTNARLFMTNDWSAVCPEFNSNAFGAKFVVSNTVRRNAVVHGEENLGREVNHILSVIARPLVIDDEEEIVERNNAEIKRRGEIELEVSNKWIQTKDAAQTLAKWISAHWSSGVEEQTVTVFGNPLFEVGDVLVMDYHAKSINPSDYKFFVVGVDTSFEQGIRTVLTLRKVRV